MSEKKNTPFSIYGKNKKLTKVISYTVDGKQYRETISVDTANGDFGRSLMIEELFYPMSRAMATGEWRTVTNKDELSTIQDDTDRITEYSNFLTNISKPDAITYSNANDALDASGMKELAEGGLAVGHNIPLPENTSKTENPKESATTTKIEPSDIFGSYNEIFKKHLKYPRDMFIGAEDVNFGLGVQANPSAGQSPFLVIFDNITPNISAYNFTWYFGDGTWEQNNSSFVTHTYSVDGLWDVVIIAEEITTMVHSEEDLKNVKNASSILFGKNTEQDLSLIDEETFLDVFSGVPHKELTKSELTDCKLAENLLEKSGFFSSKSEIRRLIDQNSISINKAKINSKYKISDLNLINNKYILLQKGKKNYFLIILIT